MDLSRISAMDLKEHVADELVEYYSEPGLEVAKMYLPVSGLWGVNFSRSGVNKGTAATQLANMLGIDPPQMIAAGDSYNDLALFEVCGLRIAMGGSPQELKSLASYVAPPVEEDGLAVAIEEFLLPMLQGAKEAG
jgi:hydroxymethylpyrimidine pyrophosphatase-like HAD family hydrolase